MALNEMFAVGFFFLMLLMNHTQQPAGMRESETSVAQRLTDGDTEEELEFWVSKEVFLELWQTVVYWERGCL